MENRKCSCCGSERICTEFTYYPYICNICVKNHCLTVSSEFLDRDWKKIKDNDYNNKLTDKSNFILISKNNMIQHVHDFSGEYIKQIDMTNRRNIRLKIWKRK